MCVSVCMYVYLFFVMHLHEWPKYVGDITMFLIYFHKRVCNLLVLVTISNKLHVLVLPNHRAMYENVK